MANPIVSGYSVNDFFWTHSSAECPTINDGDCLINKQKSDQLVSSQSGLSAAQEKYEDINTQFSSVPPQKMTF